MKLHRASSIFFRLIAIGLCLVTLSGCITLAYTFADGKQRKHERSLYIQDAKAGDKIAQYYVAQTYCCGYSAAHHSDKALFWYCQSAKQDYSRAQYRLGNIFEGDFSFTSSIRMFNNDLQDRVKAYAWYAIASEAGYAPALSKAKDLRSHLDTRDINKAAEYIAEWRDLDCDAI